MVLSRSKWKLCEKVIVWLRAWVLQPSSQKPVTMLYQLGQGKIRTNICRKVMPSSLVVIEEIIEMPIGLRSSDLGKGQALPTIEGFTPLVLTIWGFDLAIVGKGVNIVPVAIPIWPPIRYISDTGQYRCTVLGLLLFYIFNICTHTHTHTHTQNLYLP